MWYLLISGGVGVVVKFYVFEYYVCVVKEIVVFVYLEMYDDFCFYV